jgi:enoyl-CoA hydratase
VSYQLEDDVALLRLDDGKANALSQASIAALDQALDRGFGEARAVVLGGRPGRFCAGFHLDVMRSGPEAMRALVKAGAEMMLHLYTAPVPVVLACSGHALAAGAVLLTAADTCIGASGEFKIGYNEVAIGMPLPVFGVELARQRLAPGHFTAATCHARIYDPPGALEAGFLHQLAPPEKLLQRALDHARTLATILSPAAFVGTRERARGALAQRLWETLDEDLASFEISDAPR